MALANVALTDSFDTWRIRTNQLVVIDNNLIEGSHITSGTITSTNTGTAINVTAGSIKVKNNVFSSNAISLKSNSSTLTISGSGNLGTTVYFDVGSLSTSIADQSTANIASANIVNAVNDYAAGIYKQTNSAYTLTNTKIGSVTSNGSGRLWANNTTDGSNNKLVFLDLATSGVTATTYGGSTQIPTLTVDAYGRITSAANVTVQGMDYPFANNRANSANAYAVTVGAASNAYAVTVGAASNTWANTKLDNSTTTFAGSLTITGNLIMFANQTLTLGSGPSTQRPLSPSNGMIRYNTTLNNFEGYKSGVWGTIGGGGATGGATDDIFYENSQNVTANYSITTNKNAMTAGPVSINSDVVVTINVGSTWVIV